MQSCFVPPRNRHVLRLFYIFVYHHITSQVTHDLDPTAGSGC